MRSNKTAELLRRIETRRQYAKQYVLLLKPSEDTKAAAGLVESRNQNGCGKMQAVEFRSSDPWTVLPILADTEQKIGKCVNVSPLTKVVSHQKIRRPSCPSGRLWTSATEAL
jgi:thymidine kinase